MPEPREVLQDHVRQACDGHLSTIGEQHSAARIVRHVLNHFEIPEDAAARRRAADELAMLAEVIYGLAPSLTGKLPCRCAEVRETLRGFAHRLERLEA
jgi:hypothetical protein